MIQPSIIYGDVSDTIAADLLIRDSERRCAAVLLRLGGRRYVCLEDEESVEVPVTQHELAGAANLSRNSTGTMVQRLKARGLIDLGYRGMTIRAPAALRAFVDEGKGSSANCFVARGRYGRFDPFARRWEWQLFADAVAHGAGFE